MVAPFRIRGSARNHDQPLHSSPGTRRDECFLRLISGGHGWFSDRLGTIELRAGHCLLVTPEDPGQVWADPQDPYDFYRISYGGDYAELLTRRIIAGHGGRLVPVVDMAVCKAICQDIGIITLREMPVDMGLAECHLARLLCSLLPPGEEVDERRLTTAALSQFIEEHAAEPLSVARLSHHFAISPATLNRFCRRQYRRSPQGLIEDIRIELATGLLQVSELSIQDVARRVGYDDPFYFSRVFRKRQGRSPRAWRQQAATLAE